MRPLTTEKEVVATGRVIAEENAESSVTLIQVFYSQMGEQGCYTSSEAPLRPKARGERHCTKPEAGGEIGTVLSPRLTGKWDLGILRP
jgi:hypothetical protein